MLNNKLLFDNVKILDCTVRDGGICNEWHFPKEFVSKVYSAVAEAGIYCSELGYVTKKGTFNENTGPWRYTTEELLREVVTPGYNTKISVMGDVGRIGIENFKKKDDSIVDIVRLACYKNEIDEAIELAEQVVDKGYEVSINLMGITTYDADDIEKTVEKIYKSRIDMIIMADSYGGLMPNDTEHLVKTFKKGTGKMVGFHAHNNLELAFANTIRAVEAGAGIVDTSIYGFGRGAGNLPLEVVLSYISHHEDNCINMVPLLELIEDEFVKLKHELQWGYNLHYVLSGMLRIHPYYASTLLKTYNFDMKDIWSTLMRVGKQNPMKFDKKLLEDAISKRNVHESIKIRNVDFSKIDSYPVNIAPPTYANVHKGRDFLILAQGPSLKENIEKIRQFAKDKNLVVMGANYLHGLVSPDYHAFCSLTRFLQYNDFIDPKSKLLLGTYIPDEIAKKYVKREYEKLQYIDDSELKFDIKDGIIQTNCCTISVLLIGVAIAMGARKIYVAGLDGYKNIKEGKATHFYSENVKVPKGHELHTLHNVCERYLHEIRTYQKKHGMEQFGIITPTSYSDHYEKIEGF